jgi:NAD(P)H-flavin reductase
MAPRFLTVLARTQETADVVTLEIAAGDDGFRFLPGQFNMLYAFGVGEVAISISGDPARPETIVHTIRAVGPVSTALTRLQPGEQVGLRGPFGSAWPVEQAVDKDVLVLGGGIGLVPLRPAIHHLLARRAAYGNIAILYGAREPAEILYPQELDAWRRGPDIQVQVTVNRAGTDWRGQVGYVTDLLPRTRFDPANTVAMICGPEPMIRASVVALQDLGMAAGQVFVSLERNMKCAIGHCGHCQFGPHFICKDGPVYSYDRIAALMPVREL